MRHLAVWGEEARIEPLARGLLVMPSGHREFIEFALEPKRFPFPGELDDVHALPEQRLAYFLIAAICVLVEVAVDTVVDPAQRAEFHATLTHMVKHGDVFGGANRVPVGQADAALR